MKGFFEMKKILSLILAVIMLLSVMPVAYAKPATYPPEIEEYIDNLLRVFSISNFSLYEPKEQHIEVYEMMSEVMDNLNLVDIGYETLINIEADGRLDEIIALNESFDKAFAEIDKKIADGEMVCVVDSHELFKMMYYIVSHYSSEACEDLKRRAIQFNSEKYINITTEVEIASEQLGKMQQERTATQADFDAAMEKIKPFYESVIACLDGNHPYGEYVSNNDATEEADGTKTATCEYCGATDTIVDEGTKIVKEEEPISFFEKLFALIKEFFAMIFSIFG